MNRLCILATSALLLLLPLSAEAAAPVPPGGRASRPAAPAGGPAKSPPRKAAGAHAPAPAEPPRAPGPALAGVLLVTLDTTRADHMSAHGYPWRTSPEFDRIAAEGVRFSACSTTTPITGPAHASLLTGLYPQTHGAFRNGVAMNSRSQTLAQLFGGLGYRTAAFLSGWTLKASLTGLDRGFQVYDEDFTDRYRMVNSQRPADQTTDRALAWLAERSPGPFFLWVHYFDAHEPYNANPGFLDLPLTGSLPADRLPARTHAVRHYDSEIAFADRQMGRVLERLRGEGILDRTLVIVVADHGEAFGEHGYRGHGRKVHEPGIHVPLAMRLPGAIPAGKVVATAVSINDVFPTVVDLLGIGPLPGVQGESLTDFWRGGEGAAPRHGEVYALAYPGTVGHMPKFLRKLVSSDRPDEPLEMALRQGAWKLVHDTSRDKSLLYNLDEDPAESRSVLSRRPDFESWRPRLTAWYERTRGEQGVSAMTEEDVERLRSLGYAGGAAD